ncbi:MAG: hypothetical protein LBI82_03660 [Dysgonamonadaceae bacterium]|nr:hypothetical protein [Dysgonamonadaceae bacterium]
MKVLCWLIPVFTMAIVTSCSKDDNIDSTPKKPSLEILTLTANGTFLQNQPGSFTATLRNSGNATYNSRLWFYLEKPVIYNPNQLVGAGNIYSIEAGETKTITISDVITLPPDTYDCNMVFDANNNPSDMDTYQFSNPPTLQVMVKSNTINLNRDGAVINGVKWAGRNVDAPGTFVTNPVDAGRFYQWNRKVSWSTTDPITSLPSGHSWDSSMPTGTTWEKVNDPSPAGWRVPTLEELAKLFDTNKVSNEWCKVNGTIGRLFTDKTTGNIIFLPAVGCISNLGTMQWVDSYGLYWSSTQGDSNSAYDLVISNSDAKYSTFYRSGGLPVRCVAE